MSIVTDASPTPDAGSDATAPSNGTTPADTGPPREVGPTGSCEGVTCGTNAYCSASECFCLLGYTGDPDTQCDPGPCADANCAYGASCRGGECMCDIGFTPDNLGGCVLDDPPDLTMRTEQEVCERWNADYPTQATSPWAVAPTSACDWGTPSDEAHVDALRRLILYRWLVGLPSVSSTMNYITLAQACATSHAAQDPRRAEYTIPDTWACYTPQAAEGAGESIIAYGATSAADAIDAFLEDPELDSLARRRWVLAPTLGRTGFGFRGKYACMYALDDDGDGDPQFVAYPAPGPFPEAAMHGTKWSFSSKKYTFDENTQVAVTADGEAVEVTDVYVTEGNYGLPTLAFTVPDTRGGVEYEVSLSGLGGLSNSLSYTTTLVSCN